VPSAASELLIAGGGIGGLAAALALARAGRPVRVLEQAAEFTELGAGIQLAPNALRVLDRFGLAGEVMRHAVYPDDAVMIDAVTGEEITRIVLGERFAARYGWRYLVVHRLDLHRALLDAARGESAIALETSKTVTALAQTADRVEAACSDGTRYRAAALIGADGLWSFVRAQLLADGPPRSTGQVCYRGTVPIDAIPNLSRAKSMALWVGPGMHLVQYPVSRGELMNNVAVFESAQFAAGAKEYGGADELEEAFTVASPPVRSMLAHVGRDRRWVLHDRDPVSDWTRGRITLLGDAAHPALQNMAQGACMALEDGVVLADAVARCGEDYERAFREYQAARFVRTARVQLSARFMAALVHARGGVRELRNALLRTRSPESTFELDWLYRGM
jgi:salicylate hydroxylase